MGSVYIAVYLSASPEDVVDCSQYSPECAAFVSAVRSGGWPFDVGDDPSFFARHFGTPLSWGICRRDLRGALELGDVVVFLAHHKHPEGIVDYRWTGFATVAHKIRQTDIWENDDYAVFRKYLNLLILPDANGGYVHHETHPGKPHPDWLWRLTRSKGHRWRAKDFAAYEDRACIEKFVPARDRAANDELIELSPNYVIFSTNATETVVLDDPPIVAQHCAAWGPQRPELWLDTPLAQRLRGMTLGLAASHRNLRLTTADPLRTRMQQRHRHIRIMNNAADTTARWLENANRLLQDVELHP